MSLKSPIGRARGLGSAKDGLHHWWMQRISAVLLVPLSLWFVFSIACLVGSGYQTVVAWIAAPWVAVSLVIYFAALFYHSQLGVQVVIEDYIHASGTKIFLLLLNSFVTIGLFAIAFYSVFTVAA